MIKERLGAWKGRKFQLHASCQEKRRNMIQSHVNTAKCFKIEDNDVNSCIVPTAKEEEGMEVSGNVRALTRRQVSAANATQSKISFASAIIY